jgi:hypothetical protein
MSSNTTLARGGTTLPFDRFWSWVQGHPNCILRAGTPETTLYDDDDLHWHFAAEDPDTLLLQLMRGKRIVGEIVVMPSDVDYVQGEPGESDEEYVFELISESETERVASYHFILSHGYDAEDPVTPGRAVH